MAYERVNWLNKGEAGAKAINKTNLNQMDKGIYDLQNVELIAVTDTVPTECTKGGKYFNTIDKLIYTATDTNTWGTIGEKALQGIFYVVIKDSKNYYYDGTTLISVGGGSGGSNINVVNEKTESDEDTYSCDYINGINEVDKRTYGNINYDFNGSMVSFSISGQVVTPNTGWTSLITDLPEEIRPQHAIWGVAVSETNGEINTFVLCMRETGKLEIYGIATGGSVYLYGNLTYFI